MRVRSRIIPLAGAALALLLAAVAPLAAADETATGDGAAVAAAVPDTIRWPSEVGEVVFSHRMHAEDLGAECVSCHHGTVASSLELPHPGYFDDFWVNCKGCHTGGDPNPVSAARAAHVGKEVCATCHPRHTARPNVEMLTAKVAIHRSCWGCHAEERGAKASTQCTFCHQRPAHDEQSAPAPATAESAAAK